ncbi:hypothetical protein MAR_026007 [Mya arenaria]|uniref:Uncharacterized protein n=1 Tax=Mya arenaria TaxID=6604 RepID=A0ABY7EPA8_MYAAR|nr:hypothetical protein MAR_026007 [Mya arenaria]
MAALFVARRQNARRPRVFKERVVAIADVPDWECVGRYRLTKDAILRLEAAQHADLEPSTNRTMLVSSMTKKRVFQLYIVVSLRYIIM